MREDAVKARLGDLLTRDWRARAARILEEREQAGSSEVRHSCAILPARAMSD
jgi:hypothetical protein